MTTAGRSSLGGGLPLLHTFYRAAAVGLAGQALTDWWATCTVYSLDTGLVLMA